jgi:Protein of unknown function C-terminus (DUF2399)
MPWRMGAADYRAARCPGPPAPGRSPAASAWDLDLRAAGRAVMEERLVDELVADLAAG